MKTKKLAAISGIVVLVLVLIAISQTNPSGKNLESVFAEKSYSQIEDFEIRNTGGTIFFSIKTKSDLPNTSEDFEKSKVISFGYAWLEQDNDGSLTGVFSNVHTIGAFGPWHSEIVRFVPNDDGFCLFSEPMINEVSAGDNLVRTILSEDQLDFSSHEIDRAVSVVILENLSCGSGFEAKIISEHRKR